MFARVRWMLAGLAMTGLTFAALAESPKFLPTTPTAPTGPTTMPTLPTRANGPIPVAGRPIGAPQLPIVQAGAQQIIPVGCPGGANCGSCEPCIDPCFTCSPCCPKKCRMNAGVGFYYIKPYFDSNPAYAYRTGSVIQVGNAFTTVEQFDYDYEVAPRVWLGFTGANGTGARIQYWEYDQSAHTLSAGDDSDGIIGLGLLPGAQRIYSAAPLGIQSSSNYLLRDGLLALLPILDFFDVIELDEFEAGPASMVFESDLDLEVWDGEITQTIESGQWMVLASGGVRYVYLNQNYNVSRVRSASVDVGFPFIADITGTDNLRSGHSYQGLGPTASLGVSRLLGNSNLSLYGKTRGSILFGQRKHRADISSVVNVDPVIGDSFDIPLISRSEHAATTIDDLLPIIELEAGGSWSMSLGRAILFVQAGVVAQTWFGAGNASNTDLIPTELLSNQDISAGNSSNIGFFGGTLSVGGIY